MFFKLFRSLFVLCLLLLLGGCMARSGDALFSLPRTSDTYQTLQSKVQAVMGSATGISPISGSNTQTLQLVDLDQDGTQEAVAFFRDPAAEWPLKIAVFKQDDNGSYDLYAMIEGAGTDIESIEYKNLVEGSELEILVSWQVTPTVHTFAAYSIRAGTSAELMRSGYTRYLATDLNSDERAELLLVQEDSAGPGTGRMDLYIGLGSAMEFHSTAPLSDGIISLQVLESAFLSDKTPCVMLTAEHLENKYITDIFRMSETGLRNITFDEQSRTSQSTLRQHTGVLPADINGDGVSEIPITRSIPSYQSGATAANFWKLNWVQYDPAGQQIPVLSTYHNSSDRWYLELPPQWEGQVTLHRQEHANLGERAVVFSYWRGDPAVAPEAFLTIYHLSGNNRDQHATQGTRFKLWADTETIYVAEFNEGAWNCGLDKQSLAERFHAT